MLIAAEVKTKAKTSIATNGGGVRRNGLSTAIADRLREMIQEGELAPGSRIMEKELCEYFEISKTPLREALKVLVAEGLITHRQHLGYHITKIDIDEIASIFEVLHGLEDLAGRHLCTRLDEDSWNALERKHLMMVAHHHSGKRTAYYRLNQEIHQMIIDAACNPTLSAIYASLMSKIHRARGVANADTSRWQESLLEHERMMQALHERKLDVLPAVLREHSEHTADEVMKALRELPKSKQRA